MGVVYLALDPDIDRLVALKLLRVDSEEMRDRFLREARSAGRLQHPNIVTVYDVGRHGESPFIAMEYVAGQTFAELIQHRAPLSLSRKLALAAQLCGGLAYAHRAGLIHRDIKPGNLMLNDEGLLKILDFGIARMVDASVTMSGILMGTPSYMSPEQIDGTVDSRSDIFSVGAVVYELLTYRQAFPGGSQHRIMEAVLHGTPAPLSQFDADIDQELNAILERALEKSPARRYQTLADMKEAITGVSRRLDAAYGEETIAPSTPTAADLGVTATTPPLPSSRPRTATPGSRGISRAALAQRRAAQVATHLDAARKAYDDGDLEAALEAAEQAAVFDPDDLRVLDLIEQVRTATENRQFQGLLVQARERLQAGAFTDAFRWLAELRALRPADADATALEHDLVRAAEARAEQRTRERAVAAALTRARESVEAGAFESAASAAAEVLAQDAGQPEALAIQGLAASVLEERRAREHREIAASDAVSRAREEFADGQHTEALQRLREAAPHERVQAAIAELESEAAAIAERRTREETERARDAVALARADFDAGDHQQALQRLRETAPHELVQAALAELERTLADLAERREREAALAARRAEAERQRRLRAIAAQATAARSAMREGDFDDAIETLNQALRREPDAGELADLLIEARAGQAEAKHRADLERLINEGHAALERQDLDGVRTIAAELSAFDPGHPDVQATLGQWQGEIARIEDAREAAELAAEAERLAMERQASEERRAAFAVAEADRTFGEGAFQEAVATLAAFEPAHPVVAAALERLRAEAQRIPREREAAEANAAATAPAPAALSPARTASADVEEARPEQGAADAIAEATRCFDRDDFSGALAHMDTALRFAPADARARALRAAIERAQRDADRTATSNPAPPSGGPRST